MFENYLNCKKCRGSLDQPRILQCGKTICSLCSSSIIVDSNNHYDCLVCSKKHEMSKEGLPLNESIKRRCIRSFDEFFESYSN